MERSYLSLHRFFWSGILLISVGCNGAVVEDPADPGPSNGSEVAQTWNFDGLQVGKLPDGWKVEATSRKGALASWQVIADSQAPSPNQVLALTEVNHESQSTFNLCWTSGLAFLDGEISVQFKANTGEVDQGGGLIWRALDSDNYYIARFNPLEDNFRVYTVKNGVRRQLATVKIQLDAGKWHSMKIVQEGDHYKAFLNGKKLLEGNDSTFSKAGGIGLWTKADAVTSFDSLSVTKLETGISLLYPPMQKGGNYAVVFDVAGSYDILHRAWFASIAWKSGKDGAGQATFEFPNGTSEDAMAALVSHVINVELGDDATWVREVEHGPDWLVSSVGPLKVSVKPESAR